jgi:hypothetical protein
VSPEWMGWAAVAVTSVSTVVGAAPQVWASRLSAPRPPSAATTVVVLDRRGCGSQWPHDNPEASDS